MATSIQIQQRNFEAWLSCFTGLGVHFLQAQMYYYKDNTQHWSDTELLRFVSQ